MFKKMKSRITKTTSRWILATSFRLKNLSRLVPYRLRHAIGLVLFRGTKQRLSDGEECYQYFDHFEVTPHWMLVSGWFVCSSGLETMTLKVDGRAQPCTSECGLYRPEVGSLFPNVTTSHHCGLQLRFGFSPPLAPGTHLVEIAMATGGGGEMVLKKSVQVTDHYSDYLAAGGSGIGLGQRLQNHSLPGKSDISLVFFPESMEPSRFEAVLEALAVQTRPGFELIMVRNSGTGHGSDLSIDSSAGNRPAMVTGMENLAAVLDQSEARWLAFLGPRAVPWPDCLAEMESARGQHPACRLIYGDEDRSRLGNDDRHFFKPDFSDELLLSGNYIGELFFIRKDFYQEIGGIRGLAVGEAFHDLLLRASEATRAVVHIPKILHSVTGREIVHQEDGRKVIEDTLSRRGSAGRVTLGQGRTRAVWEICPVGLERSPVSIVILTAGRDADRNLWPCLKSIVDRSTYRDYEIILVDNSQGRLDRLEVERLVSTTVPVSIIDYPDPFNFPKMNNLAAAQANGKYLVLLNDDIEIGTPDWMEQMTGLAAMPHVGVVGCKLLYSNRTIQHAGVMILPTGPTHPCRFVPAAYTGYNDILAGLRNCSAVTFACAMIPVDVYGRVGGMNEVFSIEFNDVDFCLSAGEKGYRSVYTPLVEHFHKESASRCHTGQVGVCGDLETFRKKWPAVMKNGDPFFNPNLSLAGEYFTFKPLKKT